MRKRRVLVVYLLALTALGLAGCAGQSTIAAPSATPTEAASLASAESTAQAASPSWRLTGESEARFIIDEVLAGQDNTVIGVTQAVEGAFALDPAAPKHATFEPIRIDLDTLVTDSDRRNRAIRQFILQSGQEQFRYATFQIKSVGGMPEAIEAGQSYSLTLVGDLTIHAVTQPVSFAGQASLVDSSRIEGNFRSTVEYADFDLAIPDVPLVASVADTLELQFDFVALQN